MAKQISWASEDFRTACASYLQSGNINFLIGSGASMPAVSVAYDIEQTIDEFVKAGELEDANSTAYEFIAGVISGSSPSTANDSEVLTFDAYIAFISALDHILFSRKSSILPRQATIFTTNYDPFIARACSRVGGLILNDGFQRDSEDSGSQIYRPESFFDRTYRAGSVFGRMSELPTINLVKLHGCLSWVKDAANIRLREKRLSLLSKGDAENSDKIEEFLSQCFLILPNFRKFHETMFERIYYDQLRVFANSLERENALLIALGFSFRDAHILEITKRGLRNPTSQVIIPAYSAQTADGFMETFEHQPNVLVARPEEDLHIDLSAVAAFLAEVTNQEASS